MPDPTGTFCDPSGYSLRHKIKEDPRLFGGTLRGGRWCTDSGVSLVEPEGFPPLGNLPRHRLFGAVGSAPPTYPVRMKYLFSSLSICLQFLSQYSNHLALCTLQVPRDPAPVQYSVLYYRPHRNLLRPIRIFLRHNIKEDPRLFGGTLRGGRWCTDSGVLLVEPEGVSPFESLPRHRLFGAVGSAPPT